MFVVELLLQIQISFKSLSITSFKAFINLMASNLKKETKIKYKQTT